MWLLGAGLVREGSTEEVEAGNQVGFEQPSGEKEGVPKGGRGQGW